MVRWKGTYNGDFTGIESIDNDNNDDHDENDKHEEV